MGVPHRMSLTHSAPLQTYGKDKYGHTLAEVLLSDDAKVNHTLVKDGRCWWYRKYAPGDTTLKRLEAEAREGQNGSSQTSNELSKFMWGRTMRVRNDGHSIGVTVAGGRLDFLRFSIS
jgi:endonuclease YncB( thermonuclease family)